MKYIKNEKVRRITKNFSGNTFSMKNFEENKGYQIVIVCFGTPLVVGDSLGPKVGTMLKNYNLPCYIYGTEDRPITAKNMAEYIAHVNLAHKGAAVLSVDASLGKKEKIGQISVRKDGVCPAGVKGQKLRFGDVGVLGVVGENNDNPMGELLAVKEDYVSNMAYKIAIVIKQAVLKALTN